MKSLHVKGVVLFCACFLVFSHLSFAKIEAKLFENMKARGIGPANMSGRIGDIAAVIDNANIIYLGTATGGVWKSTDGGLKWQPIFDDQPSSSIGAVAVCQQNANIVWVGTGEGNPRNSSGVGRGIFKSLDAGKTWTCLGLEKTEKISRIVLHPHDPDVAYAAALGTTWGENPERGVFKTTDGGKTWQKILYVDEKTGAADLAMAPDNPNKLIAAMWQHRRWPWFFTSGGPGSGLYITGDGGENWKRLGEKEGLPKGDLGRIGVAFAPSRTEIVYAIVEAEKSVLLRSEDGGFNWKTVNSKSEIGDRPFYYNDIRVHPKNENTVYSLQSGLMLSEDGGKSFKRFVGWSQAHGDFQAMWLHPDAKTMIVGSDGGIVISRDGGRTWRFVRNLPLGQFYHTSFDMAFPFNVYGGLQDNGSWKGPSALLTEWGIFNYRWQRVGGGDGFDTEPDPSNPHGVYAMWQGGNLFYFDTKTGRQKDIKPTESTDPGVTHRYNWNAGFALDPFDKSTIYYGSQFVHRSRDRAQTWEIISPDLTSNDPEKQKQAESGGLTRDVTNAENHTSILCIAPSPVKKGVIWVGTDDGNVQLTRDDGKTWELVSTNINKGLKKSKRVPAGTWVPHVEASKFDAAEAFVVFDDHRRANWASYVFMTADYGKTWQSLAAPEIDGFAHVIEQDHVDRDLLFLGTEFGLFVSFDRGKSWMKWTAGLPTVPVRDLAVHPRDNDLVIGTHGRSIYILDDISYLRHIEQAPLENELHLFKVNDAPLFRRGMNSSYSTLGDGEFWGRNKDFRAQFTFLYNPKEEDKGERSAKDKAKQEKKLKIDILDEKGQVVNELEAKPKSGINRIGWGFREKEIKLPKFISQYGSVPGLIVLPGTYTVRLKYGDVELKQAFNVTPDPRIQQDIEVLKKNYRLGQEINNWIKTVIAAAKEMYQTGELLKTVVKLADDLEPAKKKALLGKAKALGDKIEKLSAKLIPDETRQGIFEESSYLGIQIAELFTMVSESHEPLTQAAEVRFKKVQEAVTAFLEEYNKLFETDAADFQKTLKESGLTLFKPFKPLSLESKEKK